MNTNSDAAMHELDKQIEARQIAKMVKRHAKQFFACNPTASYGGRIFFPVPSPAYANTRAVRIVKTCCMWGDADKKWLHQFTGEQWLGYEIDAKEYPHIHGLLLAMGLTEICKEESAMFMSI